MNGLQSFVGRAQKALEDLYPLSVEIEGRLFPVAGRVQGVTDQLSDGFVEQETLIFRIRPELLSVLRNPLALGSSVLHADKKYIVRELNTSEAKSLRIRCQLPEAP